MQSPKTQETVWLVSFGEDDDRELTSEEIAKALSNGEIVLTTIVWRDGMSDWKPIVEVPELRSIVQRQRVARQRSTVMGGFGTPTAPAAAPRPPQFASPRPPPAAPPPPLPRAPEPPRGLPPTVSIGGSRQGSPRGSLAGGLAAPRAARQSTIPPEPGIDELASSVLSALDDDEPDTRQRRQAVMRGGDEGRTTLTGPGIPPLPHGSDLDSDFDSEPISLAPESIAPDSVESLGSDELQSLIEEDPPTIPPTFDPTPIARRPAARDVETTPPVRTRPRAQESVLRTESSLPHFDLGRESAPRAVSRGPGAPPRPASTAVSADPLSELDDAAFAEPKKKGGVIGKLLLAAVVFAVCGGAFVLGRRSADPVTEPTAATTPLSVPVETEAKSSAPSEPTVPAIETSEPAASAANADSPSVDETVAAKVPTPSSPRSPTGRRDNENVELSREPRGADLPAPTPKPAPAEPAPKPPDEEPEEASEPFDASAASAALSQAASSAGSCRSSGDPSGVAQVSVTFSPSGRATRATVDGPPFAGTATGGCIASRMTQAKVPPFTGSRVTVKKKVVIQ